MCVVQFGRSKYGQMLLSCIIIMLVFCAASSSSQKEAMNGTFRPITSSAPVVSEGAVAAESNLPLCEGELLKVSSTSEKPMEI